MKLKPFPEAPDNKLGLGLDPPMFLRGWKLEFFFFSVMDFYKMFWLILDFWKKSKMVHFLTWFTTIHVWILEKSHKPWRRARKNEQNVHLRFLIFKTSSHTFLNDRKDIFQNVKKCEIINHSENLSICFAKIHNF